MIELKDGVSLKKGVFDRGSPYYLYDSTNGTEYHISQRMAAYVAGRLEKWHEVSQNDQSSFNQILLMQGLLKKSGSQAFTSRKSFFDRLMVQNITVLKPHEFLMASKAMWLWLFSRGFFGFLCCFIVFGLFLLSGSFNKFITYFNTYGDSKFAILMAMVFVTACHELGHSMAVVKYGGKVDRIVLMFLAGLPLPKNDISHSYLLEYSDKVKIALAGIYVEIIIASFAIVLWSLSDDGAMRSALHFIVVVSLPLKIAINLIPLMKFDGYHVLSNVLKSPRLYEDAICEFRTKVYTALGLKPYGYMKTSNVGFAFLLLYGCAVFIWRVFLPLGFATGIIILFEDRYAYLLAAIPFIVLWINPLRKEITMMLQAEKINFNKQVLLIFVVLVVLAFYLIVPIKHTESYVGYVDREYVSLKSPIEGAMVYLKEGSDVKKDDIVVEILPSKKDVDIAEADIYLSRSKLIRSNDNLEAYEKRYYERKSLNQRSLVKAKEKMGKLKASESGVWIPGNNKNKIKVGDVLGDIFHDNVVFKVFVPMTQEHPELFEGVAILQDGRLRPLTFVKTGVSSDTSTHPDWVNLGKSNATYMLYESNNYQGEVLPQMPVNIISKRKYSVFMKYYKRMKAKLLYL